MASIFYTNDNTGEKLEASYDDIIYEWSGNFGSDDDHIKRGLIILKNGNILTGDCVSWACDVMDDTIKFTELDIETICGFLHTGSPSSSPQTNVCDGSIEYSTQCIHTIKGIQDIIIAREQNKKNEIEQLCGKHQTELETYKTLYKKDTERKLQEICETAQIQLEESRAANDKLTNQLEESRSVSVGEQLNSATLAKEFAQQQSKYELLAETLNKTNDEIEEIHKNNKNEMELRNNTTQNEIDKLRQNDGMITQLLYDKNNEIDKLREENTQLSTKLNSFVTHVDKNDKSCIIN